MFSTKSGPPKWSPYLCLWVLMMGCICATGDNCYEPSQWSISKCPYQYTCKYNGTENAQCLWIFTTSTPQMNPDSCYKLVPSISLDCTYPKSQCCFNGTSDAKCCRYEPGPYHDTCYEINFYVPDRLFTCPDSTYISSSWTGCCNNNTINAECCDPSDVTTTEIPWPTFNPDYDDYDYTTTYVSASTGSVFGFVFIGCCVRRRKRRVAVSRTAVVIPQQPAVTTTQTVTTVQTANAAPQTGNRVQTGNSARTGKLAQTMNSTQTANAVPYQQPGLYPPSNYVYPNQLPPTYSGQAYPYPPPSQSSLYTIPVQNQAPPAYATQDPAGSQAGIGFVFPTHDLNSQAGIGFTNATQDPSSQTGIGFDNRSFVPTSPQDLSSTSTPQNH